MATRILFHPQPALRCNSKTSSSTWTTETESTCSAYWPSHTAPKLYDLGDNFYTSFVVSLILILSSCTLSTWVLHPLFCLCFVFALVTFKSYITARPSPVIGIPSEHSMNRFSVSLHCCFWLTLVFPVVTVTSYTFVSHAQEPKVLPPDSFSTLNALFSS